MSYLHWRVPSQILPERKRRRRFWRASDELEARMKPIRSASSASRREALFVAFIWIAAYAYTVGYAALYAYRPSAASEALFGMPRWVVWGVLLPWVVTLFLTIWFAAVGMKDEPLGENPDDE